MVMSNLVEKVKEVAAEIVESKGLELVHIEKVGAANTPIFRIFIDKPDGITIEDCSTVSRAIEEVLDAKDFIPTAYTLEVSSPGLERELYSLKDYQKYLGNLAKIKTRVLVNEQRNFRGKIIGVEGEQVIFEDKTNGIVKIPFDSIAKANLEIDVEEEFRRAKERGM